MNQLLSKSFILVNDGIISADQLLEYNDLDQTDYENEPAAFEQYAAMVKKRNISILIFLNNVKKELFGISSGNFRLIGSPNQPKIVLNNSVTFSIFVKNFKLFVSNEFGNGDIQAVFNIGKLTEIDKAQVKKCNGKFKTKYVLKLQDKITGMYFSCLNSHNHAMYTNDDPRLYTVRETAESYVEMLKTKYDIDVEIVSDKQNDIN